MLTESQMPRLGIEGGLQRHKKRLSALILDEQKFSQNFILMSRNEQR